MSSVTTLLDERRIYPIKQSGLDNAIRLLAEAAARHGEPDMELAADAVPGNEAEIRRLLDDGHLQLEEFHGDGDEESIGGGLSWGFSATGPLPA